MLEVTSSWFSWIDRLPVWAQFAVSIPLGLAFMAFIALCFFGIKWEWRVLMRNIKKLRDE